MPFVNGIWIGAGGLATVDSNAPAAGDPRIAGRSYDATTQALHTDATAVAASDVWNGGFRLTAAGALRVVDASLGLPAGSVSIGGISVSPDGQTCVHASGTIAAYVHGWPVTATGAVVTG